MRYEIRNVRCEIRDTRYEICNMGHKISDLRWDAMGLDTRCEVRGVRYEMGPELWHRRVWTTAAPVSALLKNKSRNTG